MGGGGGSWWGIGGGEDIGSVKDEESNAKVGPKHVHGVCSEIGCCNIFRGLLLLLLAFVVVVVVGVFCCW